MTGPRVSAFRWVPPFAQGLVRDLRVRWALEEVRLPYEERLIGLEDQRSEAHLSLQPFGQVPSYEEDGLVLFESGAIVLHIAERSDKLMPSSPRARARTKTWMFAALNTVEPPIEFLNVLDMLQDGDESAKSLRSAAVGEVKKRLASLCCCLAGRDYLGGALPPRTCSWSRCCASCAVRVWSRRGRSSIPTVFGARRAPHSRKRLPTKWHASPRMCLLQTNERERPTVLNEAGAKL